MGSIRRKLLSFVLGSLVCSVAVLGLAGPAAAHDAAESSNPAQDASVPVVPEKVSVTFSNKPLGIGSSFSVKDPSGTEWADGAVEIVDNVASQKVKAGAPAGQYTVAWRVVSSDSHPIEGTFSFAAAAAAGGAASSASATAAATVPAIGTARPGQTAAPESAGSGEPFQWSIVIFAAAAVGLLATLAVLARRRFTAGSDDGR
jgi:methionine-rich copper-binding protein CopC